MRRKETLKVKEGHLDIARVEEGAKLFVHNQNATILRVLEAIFGDVLRDLLSDFTARNHFTFRQTEEASEFWGDVLLTVEAVVRCTRGSLGAVRIVLFRLDLADKLRQRLDFGAEGGDFSENSFERHLISLLCASSLSLIIVSPMIGY